MLAPLLFYKWFGSWDKERKYSRHSMLAFPKFWDVTSAHFYSTMKDK